MSLIIKGMDMPKEAKSVTIDWWDENDQQIRFDDIEANEIVERVIEIPTPHGRLIDADELQELYADSDDLDLSNYDVKVAVVRQNIKDMSTILEAER